jgi:hypothetical protein
MGVGRASGKEGSRELPERARGGATWAIVAIAIIVVLIIVIF